MCDTCGCGDPNSTVTIRKPGEINHDHPVEHEHDHSHEHPHPQTHEDGHSHTHPHLHQHESKTITLEQDILSKNNLLAERNRGYFQAKNILALNLVSSPGSGKTTLLERTISDLKQDRTICVIEGDQQTLQDAERIDATGAAVVQVNTGTGCHLDADMIQRALKSLNPPNGSFLAIENVGNLVCPALFDLGEAHKVVIISVTEGDDKPYKYPTMFAAADVCIINKIDLLPYVDFDVDKCIEYARQVNHHLHFFQVSAKTGEGLTKWYDWLKAEAGPSA
ncbi:MAG: hydrogenase nickel incorporation protein HypB [Candidatus Marinimicrobia bacterium]|nr:hydrogenase nickel incorporation protein HypB [Candidatus Neomarinimicrobiota bacterium]MCF7840412.1 hydrogenase nickel incorporation protein HypB [Candidatus Neomarinimicrobiota bacterium]MCF7902846.1 hydrogenase nickel incorporation protein HypB [Candidatus Neomarinimicrobiota bacterium]